MIQKSLLHLPSRSVRSVARSRSKAWLIAAAVALIPTAPLLAGTQVSTLNQAPDEHVRLPIFQSQHTALTFKTDHQAYSLESITIGALIFAQDVSSWGPLVGHLYTADINGLPETRISTATFTLATPLIPGLPDTIPNTQQLVFNATSSIYLAAGTTYSFSVATADPNVQIGWQVTPTANGLDPITPSNLWEIFAVAPISTDGGENWVDALSGGEQIRLSGAVGAAPIPEPSTFALLGAAGALGLSLRRRRRA